MHYGNCFIGISPGDESWRQTEPTRSAQSGPRIEGAINGPRCNLPALASPELPFCHLAPLLHTEEEHEQMAGGRLRVRRRGKIAGAVSELEV